MKVLICCGLALSLMRSNACAESSKPVIDVRSLAVDQASETRYDVTGRMLGFSLWNAAHEPFRIDTSDITAKITCVHFCKNQTAFTLRARNDGSRTIVRISLPDSIPWGVYDVTALDGGTANARLLVLDREVSIPPAGWKFGVDQNLRDVRSEYIGKTVQGYGDLVLDCEDADAAREQAARNAGIAKLVKKMRARVAREMFNGLLTLPQGPRTTFEAGYDPSLRVVSIDRPVTTPKWWKIGGGVMNRWSGDAGVTLVSPLVVRFADTKSRYHDCLHPSLFMADAWEVERTLWIHSPVGVTSQTPVRKGMSKEALAHLLGFPATIGTKAEMYRLNTWT